MGFHYPGPDSGHCIVYVRLYVTLSRNPYKSTLDIPEFFVGSTLV